MAVNFGEVVNLGADPETRTLQSGGKLTKLRGAYRQSNGETGWMDFTAFSSEKRDFEKLFSGLRKGSQVFLQGELQMRTYQDKQGNQRRGYEVKVQDFRYCGPRAEGTGPVDNVSDDAAPF